MADKVMVQVRFKEKVVVNGMTLEYSDALYYKPEDYAVLRPEDLASKKAERVNNWKYMLEHPPVEVPPTKEQLQAEIEQMEEQKVQLETRKIELQGKISLIETRPVEEPIVEG